KKRVFNMARKRKFTLSSKLAAAVAAETNSTPVATTSATKTINLVPANNPTSAQNQQELSANSLPNNANSLLSNEISADQWKSSPYILSDDDEDLSSSVSVVTLLNNNNNSGQDCLR
ncbi:11586_t:CDS:2, partial [Funneliformis caledonium]